MKVAVVTGTRAEYGLLYHLIKEIDQHKTFDLQLLVTGMHLSPEFGLTVQTIEKDFPIAAKVETLLSSDTPIGISKSIALGVISFSEVLDRLKPDILIVLGDRYEIFAAATAAMIARIPMAHIHGGESTEGAVDEAIRHSISKMSQLHFTATEVYKKRVIQLGEMPNKVFNVGGIGIDAIKKIDLLSKKEFEKSINFQLKQKSILATFHPTTLEESTSEVQFQQLLTALSFQKDTTIIFTKANSDTDGRVINKLIDEFVANNSEKAVSFTSLGQLRYLSALNLVDCVVGNSSSGLAEAPTFKVPTINIGDRQKGRIMADSVINCKPNTQSILAAIELAFSSEFQTKLKTVKNPYGEGGATKKIIHILENIKLDNILKKSFNDF